MLYSVELRSLILVIERVSWTISDAKVYFFSLLAKQWTRKLHKKEEEHQAYSLMLLSKFHVGPSQIWSTNDLPFAPVFDIVDVTFYREGEQEAKIVIQHELADLWSFVELLF